MSSPTRPGTSDIFETNPYEDHPSLSPIESQVLWEYAKLAENVKQLSMKTRNLGQDPDETLLPRLRSLEKKMGLVFTLFKASVWGVINEQPVEPSYSGYSDSNSGDQTVRQ
ncbi:dash complex subunit dad3 [Moniliophthora roreri MCA 2997]|uniref:DASH complex subunit DAD3 n=2 Tax=Moniliophthora roreri TaxID=221103 RepID=V2XNQ6_MONRO|nr:dash complex subunit dad3 [Moniliophthora roreri MCA 2997]